MPRIQQLSSGPASASAPNGSLPHVLLVVDGFPKALGGGERIVLRLAELLPQYGYRVSILTFRVAPDGEFHPDQAPCPVYLLPLTNTYGVDAFKGALAFRRFLGEQQVRIVETFFESSDIWAGFVTHFFSRARLVWSRRDMGILRGAKHRWAYKAMRNCPDAVIAVSKRVADHVIHQDGVRADRVHVVHNGLDLESLAAAQPGSATPRKGSVVTTIGNVRKVKGHDLLVQAAQLVKAQHPEVTFTIAGEVLEPAFYADLQEQLSSLHLSDSVHFLGKVRDLPRHLAQAHIFVLPSRSEGFSNALVEAMAMGLPVIATDVGGNGEAVDNGRNGILIPPEDVGALASAINTLLSDRELALSLGRAAKETVQRQFTADAMMRAVTDVFASVLS